MHVSLCYIFNSLENDEGENKMLFSFSQFLLNIVLKLSIHSGRSNFYLISCISCVRCVSCVSLNVGNHLSTYSKTTYAFNYMKLLLLY